jgi:hypothetical protein
LEDNFAQGQPKFPVHVYPNPGRDVFNILMEQVQPGSVTLFLYNMNGQMLQQREYSGIQDEFHIQMDLSGHASGIYHLQLINGRHMVNRKLIKE